MYLEKWSKQEQVTETFKISKYYWKMYDINHWVHAMNKLSVENLCQFAWNFCSN